MEFEYSKKTKMYMEQLTDFMGKQIYAAEPVFHEQLNAERDTQKIAGKTPEFREGVSAFLEKRKARFDTIPRG